MQPPDGLALFRGARNKQYLITRWRSRSLIVIIFHMVCRKKQWMVDNKEGYFLFTAKKYRWGVGVWLTS